jgi:hypothetical protein
VRPRSRKTSSHIMTRPTEGASQLHSISLTLNVQRSMGAVAAVFAVDPGRSALAKTQPCASSMSSSQREVDSEAFNLFNGSKDLCFVNAQARPPDRNLRRGIIVKGQSLLARAFASTLEQSVLLSNNSILCCSRCWHQLLTRAGRGSGIAGAWMLLCTSSETQ